MKKLFTFTSGLLVTVTIGLSSGVSPAQAQDAYGQVSESILHTLYDEHLKNPESAYIQKRIQDERAAIRAAIEAELQKNRGSPSRRTGDRCHQCPQGTGTAEKHRDDPPRTSSGTQSRS